MAKRIIDGTSKENIYCLLCNLADLDNKSIIFSAINERKASLENEKEQVDNELMDVSNKLEIAKEQKEALVKGPYEFEGFVKSFDGNKILRDYLGVLGYGGFLDECQKAHNEELKSKDNNKKVDKDVAEYSGKLDRLEEHSLSLDQEIDKASTTYDNIKNATEDVKYLIDASINGNGSFNKDYVIGLLTPFKELAEKFDIVFPNNFVEEASKAIFFPEDGFSSVVKECMGGKYKEILFTTDMSDKIEVPNVEPEEVIKEVSISGVDEESNDINLDDIFGVDTDEDEVKNVTDSEENLDIEEGPKESEEDEEDDDNVGEVIVPNEVDEEEVSNVEEVEDELEEAAAIESREVTTINDEEEPDEELEKTEEEKIESVVDFEEEPEIEEVPEEVEEMAEKIIDGLDNMPVAEEEPEEDEEKSTLNIDMSKASTELKKLVADVDEKLVNSNIENLKALNVSEESLYYVNGNYSYLTDVNLVNKLNYLRGKGISEKSLVDAINLHFIDCSLESIKEGVNSLENSDLGFDKQFLPVFRYGIDSFFKAMEILRNNGIEPDASEIKDYLVIITKCVDNIEADISILKDYGISLLRKNGKYELGLFVKGPMELLQSIDDIIENGEEDLLSTTPEVLTMNVDTIVERLNYVKTNNIDYKEGEVYVDYIFKPGLFDKEFDNPSSDVIVSSDECNSALNKSLSNDLCSIFIDALDRCYKEDHCYKMVDLGTEEKGVYETLKNSLEKEFEAKIINKNTYQMKDTYISRNKFERNLSCLVSLLLKNGEDLISESKEILTVAALYNSRRAEGMITIPQHTEE